MRWNRPDSAEDWLARFAVILLLTAAICIPIVGGVMWLLAGAPAWSIIAAILLVIGALTWLAFAQEVEDFEEDEPWELQRPVGARGWLKFAGGVFVGWIGLCLIVNVLILDLLVGAGDPTKGIATIVLLPLAIVLELYLGGDDAKSGSASEPAPEHVDQSVRLFDA